MFPPTFSLRPRADRISTRSPSRHHAADHRVASLAPTFKPSQYLSSGGIDMRELRFSRLPPDHPGRAKSDNTTSIRIRCSDGHTSARRGAVVPWAAESDGYLISADVYRRDEVDRSHYPVFHQMEGAGLGPKDCTEWRCCRGGTAGIWSWLPCTTSRLRIHKSSIPPGARNPPRRSTVLAAEAEALGLHLKRSLEADGRGILLLREGCRREGRPKLRGRAAQGSMG